MTTEDDFQAALDANPDDWQTRLVFADWLEERGDPRAEGYRALGVLRRAPTKGDPSYPHRFDSLGWSWWSADASLGLPKRHHLPTDWRDELPTNPVLRGAWGPTRRAAEDAAALAFTRLPPQRRAEILTWRPPTGAGSNAP